MQYLNVFYRRPEAASNIIFCRFVWLVDRDKRVKFRDRRLNRSRESPLDAVGSGIFDGF